MYRVHVVHALVRAVGGAVRESPISGPISGDEQSKRFPFVALAFWALFAFVVIGLLSARWQDRRAAKGP